MKFPFIETLGTSYGAGAIATDPDPNSSPPTSDRIRIVTKQRKDSSDLLTLFVQDGTALSGIWWVQNPTHGDWFKILGLRYDTVNPGAGSMVTALAEGLAVLSVQNIDSAKLFFQVVTNTGGVTKAGWTYSG